MSALFDAEPAVPKDARLSLDGQYRYALWRDWRSPRERPTWATFVMLNPSTADASIDDPTIRRCIGFARGFDCTGLAVVNLYAYRATKPTDLWVVDDPVGPDNDATLAEFFAMSHRYGGPLIAAWGAHAKPDRVAHVIALPGSERLQALHVTKSGAPGHPLYLPATSTLSPWATSDCSRHGLGAAGVTGDSP